MIVTQQLLPSLRSQSSIRCLWMTVAALALILASTTCHAGRDDGDEEDSVVTQSNDSNIEAAKSLAVNITPISTFDLPPRSINDILDVLQRYSQEISAPQQRIETLAAETSPPADMSMEKFLVQRATANRTLGRYRQGITDATAALGAEDPIIQYAAYIELFSLYEELGEFDTARESVSKALALLSYDWSDYIGNVLLANLQSYSGRLDESTQHVERLENYRPARNSGGNFMRSLKFAAQGFNLFYRGEYTKAQARLAEGIALNESDIKNEVHHIMLSGATLRVHSERSRAHLMRYQALSALRQGRSAEAEALAREVVTLQARFFGTYSGQTAEGLGTLMEILAEQGRTEDTVKLAKVALEVYDRMGAESNSLTRAAVQRALGDALVASGKWQAARDEYQAIESGLNNSEDVLLLFQFNLTWAIPLIELGQAQIALDRLKSIQSRLAQNIGQDRYETAEATGFAASAHHVLGNASQALAGFQAAVPILLARTNQSDTEEQTNNNRSLRLKFILEHYIDALTRRGLPKDIEESFRISNAIRASRVDEALAAAAARTTLTDPELARVARNEQDTLQQIKALNGLLARSGGRGPADQRNRDSLLSKIAALKAARNSLLKHIAVSSPEYVGLIDPQVPDVAAARSRLLAKEALITTYTTRRSTHIWAIQKSGAVHHAEVDLPAAKLNQIISQLRLALEPDAETLADLPAFDVKLAHTLYQLIFKPVDKGWKNARRLIIVAHGALATLPLVLLPTTPQELIRDPATLFAGYRKVPWWVRSHSINALPSVSSLLALRTAGTRVHAGRPFIGFGDPVFSLDEVVGLASTSRSFRSALRSAPNTRAIDSAALNRLPRLPDTTDEIISIARAVGADLKRDVFLRKDANETKVKALSAAGILGNYQVVSFATHGLVAGDLDGLTQPALALSSPIAVQGGTVQGGGDGLLDMEEVLGLKLNSDWAVLSACNTAAADGAGAEAVSGLGRAFFYAGSRAVLVSNWPVHSAATTYLMTDLFSRYSKNSTQDRADSLRETMLKTIDEGVFKEAEQTLFSYAHPLFWAPFSLVGDGAR